MLRWYSWCVRWSEEPEDAVRFRGEAPCFCSSKVEHSTDNRETLDRYHPEAPFAPVTPLAPHQVTGLRISSVGVAVKHTRLSSVEIIGSNPIRGTNIEFIRLNPNWYRDLTVNQATVGSNPTKRASLVR